MKIQVCYKIYDARIKAGLSLRQLSELSGVSKSTINYAENNQKNISVETLCMLANALKTRPEKLFSYQVSNIVDK